MDPTGGMKIIDLPIECLKKIFQLLEVSDLLNLADVNKTLKKAAESAYAEYHGEKMVEIACIFLNNTIPRPFTIDDLHSIFIRSIKHSLQFVRCFGHLITNLDIFVGGKWLFFTGYRNYELFRANFKHLIDYVNQFCTLSALTELKIIGLPGGALQTFVEPFVNVESVCIQPSDLDNISLAELFPNMRRLGVYVHKQTDLSNVEHCFPKVKHLKIIGYTGLENPLGIIRLNPQLESLALPFTTNGNLMQNISDSLPNLQALKIEKNTIQESLQFDDDIIVHFENVKKLEIRLDNLCMQKIPFSFRQLEELTLQASYNRNNPEENKNDFYKFIRENPSIKKLNIDCFDKIDLFQLANPLQIAREIFVACMYSVDEITSFLNQDEVLQKCSFRLVRGYNAADLEARLSKKWAITVHCADFCREIKTYECVRVSTTEQQYSYCTLS